MTRNRDARISREVFSDSPWSWAQTLRRSFRASDLETVLSGAHFVVRKSRLATPVGGFYKRSLDILVALIGITMLSPLILLVLIAIKLADNGPILFAHRRIGYNGVPFSCFKFRTMVADAEAVLQYHLAIDPAAMQEWQLTRKLKDDPRVTRLGVFLRKKSIDEIPQLINIMKGEMSIVGPRPIVEEEIGKYGSRITHYLRARPGLTGEWQISGRNDTPYDARVALDCDYVENWNAWRDLRIISKTFVAVVTSKGCY